MTGRNLAVCREYLIPPWTLVLIVFVVVCLSYSVVAGSVMASSRSSEMDQAGPSFFGPTTRNVFGPCTRYEV